EIYELLRPADIHPSTHWYGRPIIMQRNRLAGQALLDRPALGASELLGANGVGHAFLREARFRRAIELLFGCLGRARSRCILFTLRHEALERCTGKLLVGSLALACRVLRKSGRGEC